MLKLAQVQPGTSTALQVQAILDSVAEGSVPGPLWNDLLDYEPPVATPRAAPGGQLALDNELLRAARESADCQYVLFWAALNLADTRLDEITRLILTDPDGRFDAAAVDRTELQRRLMLHASANGLSDFPTDDKSVTNILSLLERCLLIVPEKRGGSIIGVEQVLPTRGAAKSLVTLVQQRLSRQSVEAVPGGEMDLALAIGANRWLGLSRSEFIDAVTKVDTPQQSRSTRRDLPDGLKELETQLRRKRQVVLQGPPGAGKTYVARQYITWATAGRGEASRLQAIIDDLPENERTVTGIVAEIVRRGLTAVWDIVQFHPGYDYTDFVRALVAEPHANGVTFTPKHRIFSLVAAVGVELQRENYPAELVLVLDEINRGDIPNIFGELLYALEYRDEAVSTPYSIDGDASITVPQNVSIIGTMNTADRSIAVIDYALRRRFVFLDIAASDSALHSYPYDEEATRSAALYLADLTRGALADAPAGLKVGPSYFLASRDGADTSTNVLASRYVYEVLPLLREYEMEGELDPTALSDLRQRLGISAAVSQQDQVSRLAQHLIGRSSATEPAAEDNEPQTDASATGGADSQDVSPDEPANP
jgi:5-methylcytosine-specific restriction protein B